MLSDIIIEENPIDNEYSYAGLTTVIEAGQGMMLLIIASCESGEFQQELIGQYENELAPVIPSYRITLDRSEPSLRAALEKLVNNQPELKKPKTSAVISVLGAADLMSIPIRDDEKNSALDRFFGYLQWTREGLREFQYPIVLWVTPRIMNQMIVKAPDFWRWRGGVFRFAVPMKTAKKFISDNHRYSELFIVNQSSYLPLDELLGSIEELEQKNKNSPVLATLLDRVGQVYASWNIGDRIDNRKKAIKYFQRATDIQMVLNLKSNLLNTLIRLANLYYDLGSYQAVEDLCHKSLKIQTELGDNSGMATSWVRLGHLAHNRGDFDIAAELYQRSIEAQLERGDSASVATSYRYLGDLAQDQGNWAKAKELYQESLELFAGVENRSGIAISWGAIGEHELIKGNFEAAEECLNKEFTLMNDLHMYQHIATISWRLAQIYRSKQDHQKAQEHYEVAYQLFTQLKAKKDLERIEANWNSALP